MSVRILRNWEEGEIQHTALDDYESFIWVLFWTVLHILKTCKHPLSAVEIHWYQWFSGSPPVLIHTVKVALLSQFRDGKIICSEAFKPWVKIFTPLFNLAETCGGKLQEFVEKKEDISKLAAEYAQKYCECLIDAIGTVPESWE
jgi:hypothetical protein